MPKLTLIRGLPDSEKNDLGIAMASAGVRHLMTDHYFEGPNGFDFRPRELHRAHDLTQALCKKSLKEGYDVVVTNTFTQLWEIAPYARIARDVGAELVVLVATKPGRNVRAVPPKTMRSMRERWDDYPGERLV